MKKKTGSIMIFASFIVLLAVSVAWLFCGDKMSEESNENRNLATKPKLSIDNYDTYSSEYNSYFNDHIPFRNELVTINTAIDFYIFKKSSSPYVIPGKNDWLFYSKYEDGDPVGCYQGTNLLTNEELRQMTDNFIKQRDYLLSQGKEFIIFIAPNKERIYSEYMPARYGEAAEEYAALQFYEYARKNTDLRVVYPYAELIKAKNELKQNIWYKTDTHWNMIGGYVGAAALLHELGIKMPDIASDKIRIEESNEYMGDLAKLLNLNKFMAHKDMDFSVVGYNGHNMQAIEVDPDNVFIFKSEQADCRKIYMIRDSFASAMAPYIASQFNDSYFIHVRQYNYQNFLEQDPNIVVYEMVERNLRKSLGFRIN